MESILISKKNTYKKEDERDVSVIYGLNIEKGLPYM